jgi:acyl dehydratase
MPVREITSVEELRSLTGLEVAVSDWFEVTQERINLFADATGDHQWIHVDVERAKAESPYGATIAHGFLTLSLLPQLMSETVKIKLPIVMGVNYGLNKVRFPSAVLAGSKIRTRAVLKSLDEVEGGQQLVWNITVERDGGDKPCCVAEWLVRYYTR